MEPFPLSHSVVENNGEILRLIMSMGRMFSYGTMSVTIHRWLTAPAWCDFFPILGVHIKVSSAFIVSAETLSPGVAGKYPQFEEAAPTDWCHTISDSKCSSVTQWTQKMASPLLSRIRNLFLWPLFTPESWQQPELYLPVSVSFNLAIHMFSHSPTVLLDWQRSFFIFYFLPFSFYNSTALSNSTLLSPLVLWQNGFEQKVTWFSAHQS